MKNMSLKKQDMITGYIFIAPFIIGFLVFIAGPMLFSLYASFTNYNITSKFDFVGLRNYSHMFTKDQIFWTSFKNTIIFVVLGVPIFRIAAIALSILLNNTIKGMRVFRTIFYLPVVMSGVATFLLWMQMFHPAYGLVNTVLSWVGIEGPAWLVDPFWTKPALVLMGLWAAGGNMLLYLARLKGIPQQLYESAEIDGANGFHRLFKITIPMLTPIIFFDLITGMIGAFQVFQSAYVMTGGQGGGPMNSLLFYNYYLWNKAFKVFDMGYATAMSWFLFIVIMSVTVFNLKFSKKWVYYEGADFE
ncbi:MAG: carbohydrate ABC transporter permease [bacterium]